MSRAYYNEHDPEKAQWIRELIKAGVVAPGDVDERSITDVQPDDLRGYTQCHFFAGIAVWSYALRLAGWPDDREVWTGSCPCPSFSCAGKGRGFNDPRHLWPAWIRLIRECRPPVIFGEQADDAIGYGWLDLVQTDMEAEDYAIGKAVLGACSVGAPHIRQRLYFVAESGRERCNRESVRILKREPRQTSTEAMRSRGTSLMANTKLPDGRAEHQEHHDSHRRNGLGRSGDAGELGDTNDTRSQGLSELSGTSRSELPTGKTGALNWFWSNAEWIYCRDEKYRPVEPGTFPLAHGAPARVLRLRGYGDAINSQVAKEFITSYLEAREQVTA